MRRWKPQPSWRLAAALLGLIAAATGLVVVSLPVGSLLAQPPAEWPINRELFLRGLAILVLGLLTAVLAYRFAVALTLTYTMDRNGLYLLWLGNRVVVPIQAIERVERGLGDIGGAGLSLIGFGYLYRRARLADGRMLHHFSTRTLAQTLLVHTAHDAYAISPQESDVFVQELEQRRRLGPIQQLTPGFEAGRAFSYAFWEDRLVQISLFIAALLNLTLLGWLMSSYPDLPALIDLRHDATGAMVTLSPRHQILFLPLAALLSGLLNLGLGIALYRRTATGAQLLQVGTAVVQLLFLVAALTILWGG
jgi:hypothetical protein